MSTWPVTLHCCRATAYAGTAYILLVIGAPAMPGAQNNADGMIHQELSEPFSYFRAPTDQLGFEGSPKAIIVTYDGAFVSAYGQLSFYVGGPSSVQPVRKRVKTLLDGYLPVIQFGFDQDGLRYEFEGFVAPVGLDPRANLVAFIQCSVRNPGREALAATVGANYGDIASAINVDPTYDWFTNQRQALKRALRTQRADWHSKLFMDDQRFAAGLAQVAFANGKMTQGDHLVFTAPSEGATPGMPKFASSLKEASVEYDLTLRGGEGRVLRFTMPAVPTDITRVDAVAQITSMRYDEYRAKVIDFWKTRVAAGTRFSLPDPKVMNTFKTSLVNDLAAREVNEDGRVYQRVNRIHYNYFWIRDGSFFVRTYDLLGLPALARQTLDAFLVWQDGKPVSFFKPGAPQPPNARLSVQDDYWGQVLWAVGAHIRTADDHQLLEQIYPLLGPHIDDFVTKSSADPRGLWPVAGPYDNEAITGHYTGHSFWALLGLRYAVFMAHARGQQADAERWQKIHDDYQRIFLKELRDLAATADGYIPPGLDKVTDGNDWDNASGGLSPFEVLLKDDPLARKTLEIVRDNNYQEGIMTYGGNAWVAKQQKDAGSTTPRGTLHHYETFYVTEGNTVLGEQQKVIEDLYALLLHTSSTNAGFEFGIPAWSTRDPQGNFTPHGWFAARYMEQIRNLLVREEGTEVHITSALAPAWVRPGQHLRVDAAPTFFGSVSYSLDGQQNGATLTIDGRWKAGAGPSDIVFHLPWFVTVVSATVDGRPAAFANGVITLPPQAHRAVVRWLRGPEPNLSYEEAVRLYLDKYYRRPAGADYDFIFPHVR